MQTERKGVKPSESIHRLSALKVRKQLKNINRQFNYIVVDKEDIHTNNHNWIRMLKLCPLAGHHFKSSLHNGRWINGTLNRKHISKQLDNIHVWNPFSSLSLSQLNERL